MYLWTNCGFVCLHFIATGYSATLLHFAATRIHTRRQLMLIQCKCSCSQQANLFRPRSSDVTSSCAAFSLLTFISGWLIFLFTTRATKTESKTQQHFQNKEWLIFLCTTRATTSESEHSSVLKRKQYRSIGA